MELYLSDFTAFLEIWVGTILLLLYRSISFSENDDNNNQRVNVFVHSAEELSRMYNDFLLKYQGYFPNEPWCPDIVDLIRNSSLSLCRITRRYRWIAIVTIIYGLFILLYIGIEKKYPNIHYLLILTDILVVIYLLLLSFINSNYIVNLSLLLVVLIVAPVIMLWAFHIPYNTFFSIIPRSTVTIITLFTCCVFVFFAFSIRFLAYRIQFRLINRAIRKYDSEIQTLLRIMQDDSELKVEKLSRRSREFIEEYYGNHSLSNPPSKNVVIKNLILDRLSDFMMTFGDVVH